VIADPLFAGTVKLTEADPPAPGVATTFVGVAGVPSVIEFDAEEGGEVPTALFAATSIV
jgi:hypothetical protein